jgi:hypothetical protein
MKHAPWTQAECREKGQRGGAISGCRRRRAAMRRSLGPVDVQAILERTGSTLTSDGREALDALHGRIYLQGWDRGYQAGWGQRKRDSRVFLEQQKKTKEAA